MAVDQVNIIVNHYLAFHLTLAGLYSIMHYAMLTTEASIPGRS
jgi:hypothetical protein